MTEYRAEGGPIDGQTITVHAEANTLIVPITLPWNVRNLNRPELAYETAEYRRSGRVFRWVGLIDDAQASGFIAEEVFRDEAPRRYFRAMLRDELERLAAERRQAVDRVVWVVGRDPHRMMLKVVGVTGGRRAERAAALRAELRGRTPGTMTEAARRLDEAMG